MHEGNLGEICNVSLVIFWIFILIYSFTILKRIIFPLIYYLCMCLFCHFIIKLQKLWGCYNLNKKKGKCISVRFCISAIRLGRKK